jgi:hypothetical protein
MEQGRMKRTMTVVDDQVWLFHQVMTNPQSSDPILVNLVDLDRGGQVSMTEHAKSKERVSHFFGEEDTANLDRYIGKSISHATNDNVLEDRGTLYKWGLPFFGGETSLLDELVR